MWRLIVIATLLFAVGGASAADTFEVRLVSQTNSTITLGWDPQPGYGYIFSADGKLVSQTNDPTRTTVKFSKQYSTYEIAAIIKGATGVYPPFAPPPPSGGVSPPITIVSNCSVDVTSALLTWLNGLSAGTSVQFGSGCYRIEGTLELRNKSGLTFNGGTFKSLNAPDDQRAIWRIIDSSGITFFNMAVIGSFAQSETNPTHNAALQHAHAIDLRGTSANISHLTASNLAGDCVYFGLGYTSATRSSGSVTDSSCRLISRNAVSVTAGDDITIERMSTSGIGFIAFDIEPNVGAGWGSSRVSVRNNTIGSYYLYAYALIENAPLSDQSFNNNTSNTSKGMRVAALPYQSFRPQHVMISGNTTTASTPSPAFDIANVDTLTVSSNQVPTTTLLKCTNVIGLTFSGNLPNTSSGC